MSLICEFKLAELFAEDKKAKNGKRRFIDGFLPHYSSVMHGMLASLLSRRTIVTPLRKTVKLGEMSSRSFRFTFETKLGLEIHNGDAMSVFHFADNPEVSLSLSNELLSLITEIVKTNRTKRDLMKIGNLWYDLFAIGYLLDHACGTHVFSHLAPIVYLGRDARMSTIVLLFLSRFSLPSNVNSVFIVNDVEYCFLPPREGSDSDAGKHVVMFRDALGGKTRYTNARFFKPSEVREGDIDLFALYDDSPVTGSSTTIVSTKPASVVSNSSRVSNQHAYVPIVVDQAPEVFSEDEEAW